MASTDFAENRRRMVKRDIARRGITDPGVLAAMGKVPREVVCARRPAGIRLRRLAAADRRGSDDFPALYRRPDDGSRRVKAGDRVLEIGTGSGYSTAALAEMGCEVFSIDRHPSNWSVGRGKVAATGYMAIHLRSGDGTLGWPEEAPFDAIIVTARRTGNPGHAVEAVEDQWASGHPGRAGRSDIRG